MRTALPAYAAALVTLLVLDAVWLGTMVPALYRPALAHLLAPAPALLPAGLFYLLYAAGVVGLVAYGTYDLTSAATLRDWPVVITVADMAWGVVITTAAALAATGVSRRLTARG